jgi:hypothetical protein
MGGGFDQMVQHRRWTLGEVVSAAADGGLCVRVLKEEQVRNTLFRTHLHCFMYSCTTLRMIPTV